MPATGVDSSADQERVGGCRHGTGKSIFDTFMEPNNMTSDLLSHGSSGREL